ncbi:intraflagellar transport protein 88 homolog [Hyalella azteca]|uniref:Intraflagellar transport protein 88 homolog n=1 Tax=Hyalella azteca TaxID=294128 RepID=A0A979FXG9_HYAAZ|nr:intraflagellar transport protein 88 homolog [Hyalella azteca]
MCAAVHPAPNDDLYAGFDDVHPALDIKHLQQDPNFQEAVRTSYGRRPPTQSRAPTGLGRLSTALPGGTGQKTGIGLGTAGGSAGDGLRRPMTSVMGTGYSSQQTLFDPMNQTSKGPAPPLLSKADESPEAQLKASEKRITALVEESCLAMGRGDRRAALERAKEASSKERSLIRQREQAGLNDAHNLDLTFSVLFNLANQYAANEMYTEALNTYQIITKDRMFNNSGRLRVNMGNIYFKTGNYAKAIKYYRMAYDQVNNTNKNLKIRIMHNIGLVFIKMGQYSEACTSFEYIMQEQPNFQTGLDLVTAHYALRDKEKMKKSYLRLLDCVLDVDDDEKYTATADDAHGNLILEVIRNDSLRKVERQLRQEAERAILTAAKLISPVIEEDYSAGYNWCVNAIKNSAYPELASDLEINKAVMFLRQKNFREAVDTLKMFEKKETKVASTAATNLSFLYILQKDLSQAELYASQARDSNGYNEAALVNLGNVCYLRGDYEKARELYLAALDIDAAAVEALYNLGPLQPRKALYCLVKALYNLREALYNTVEAVYNLVKALYNLGEALYCLDEAIHCLNEALCCIDEALYCLGEALYCLDEALYCLDEALYNLGEALYCLDEALYNLGEALYCLDEALYNLGEAFYCLDEAILCLEEALYCLDEALYCLDEALYCLDEALYCLGEALYNTVEAVYNFVKALYNLELIAHLYQMMGDSEQASEWYLQVLSLVPTDSHILERLGQIFDGAGDKQQAYQYYFDSFRYFPSNLDVIDWLGSYFIELQYPEKAIEYFERAALMQPDDPKWQLMVAACHRRAGAYHKAFSTYKLVHMDFPENIECLKMLVRLSSDLGLAESGQYAMELKKAEQLSLQRETRAASSGPGSRRSSSRASRSGSAMSGIDGAKSPMDRAASSRSYGGVRSFPGSAVSGRATRLSLESDAPGHLPATKEIDVSYQDPVGPIPERPRTSMRRDKPDDDFGDDELGDDLLP